MNVSTLSAFASFWSCVLLCGVSIAQPASSPSTRQTAQDRAFLFPNRIRYDSKGMQIEGRNTFIYSGAFHYFRCPKELWRDRFEKMKEAGFNCVETYVPWNWHERQPPGSVDDFSQISGLGDLDDWMTMAEQFGFYIIIRPGPYICSEWSGGGFPQWLVSLKKPVDWPTDQSWLQTDDPQFVDWSRHWYRAVCPSITKHQLMHRSPGTGGIILFQIENEYERLNWLPRAMKKRYLEALADCARRNGIDVPLFTCWTREARNVQDGPLSGVFDMMNFYPKWNIKRGLTGFTEKQRKEQPDAPAMSAELQGGWYSEVGGGPSGTLPGASPACFQNLTLYEMQLGFSLINYYMLVGGTNFDDWASRETTTTYDFAAAIHENGGTDEKYERAWGLGRFLHDHGVRIARGEAVAIESTISDPEVEIAERQATDGSRYFFVRTENRDGPHRGSANIREPDGTRLSFDFELEPFGSRILYLPAGVNQAAGGEWLPKRRADLKRPAPADLPPGVQITTAMRRTDPLPTMWTRLAPGDLLEKHGIFDRHFLYYHLAASAGASFTVDRLGENVVGRTHADGVLATAGGTLFKPESSDKTSVTFTMPAGAGEAILLYENRGLHQHTKPILEQNWNSGIRGARANGSPLTLEFAGGEEERGIVYSQLDYIAAKEWISIRIGDKSASLPDALLTWHRMTFELPDRNAHVWVPWHLHMEAKGNGFIYLNGHCIGRYWEAGPQVDYFLPECWLNFGKDMQNVIALSLRPNDNGVGIFSARVEPDAAFAERR